MKQALQSIFRLLLLPVIAAVAIGTPAQAQDAEALIDRAMTGSHRSDANKARDKYRHPKETLLFFGLRPEMTVVEVWPSAGWWTDILAPVLKGGGQYYAAWFATQAKGAPDSLKDLEKKFDAMLS